MDFPLISLVRGEGGPLWPTRHERLLLKFALDTFGEMLTRFLLAGFGEKKVAPRWSLAVTFTGANGTLQKRRLRVITHEPADGSSWLPRGRDPLVFIALLRLLLHKERQRADYLLVFHEQDILKLLGWKDTDNHREEINRAIRRYAQLIYEWELNSSELVVNDLADYTAGERPILQYESHSNETEDGRIERDYNRVSFSEWFINRLFSRSLFSVAWDKVKSIKLTTSSRRRN